MIKPPYILRELNLDDAVLVAQHVREVCETSPHLDDPRNDWWLTNEYSVEAVEHKIYHYYSVGAFEDSVLVGTGFASVESGLLSGIYVSVQGKGIGSAIIAELLSHLQAHSVTRIEASVHPKSASMRHLLARYGFIIEGTDPDRSYFHDVNFEILVLDASKSSR